MCNFLKLQLLNKKLFIRVKRKEKLLQKSLVEHVCSERRKTDKTKTLYPIHKNKNERSKNKHDRFVA